MEEKNKEKEAGMKKLPGCAVKNCNNPGFIIYGGKIICGNCFYKLFKMGRKSVEDAIEKLGEEI